MAQFLGRVIGTKMDKTAKVLVTKLKLHPYILKVVQAHILGDNFRGTSKVE